MENYLWVKEENNNKNTPNTADHSYLDFISKFDTKIQRNTATVLQVLSKSDESTEDTYDAVDLNMIE